MSDGQRQALLRPRGLSIQAAWLPTVLESELRPLGVDAALRRLGVQAPLPTLLLHPMLLLLPPLTNTCALLVLRLPLPLLLLLLALLSSGDLLLCWSVIALLSGLLPVGLPADFVGSAWVRYVHHHCSRDHTSGLKPSCKTDSNYVL